MKKRSICRLIAIGVCCLFIASSVSSAHIGVEKNNTIQEDTHESFLNPTSCAYAPSEIIVHFKNNVVPVSPIRSKNGIMQTGISSFDRLNEEYGVVDIKKVFNSDDSSLKGYYKLTLSEGKDVLSVVESYKKDPVVVSAQPNYRMDVCLTPNDPYYSSSGSWGQNFSDLYGLHLINTSWAWNSTTGSTKVIVAVIDTGVDYTHEDLKDNMWVNPDETPGNGIDDDSDGFIDNIYGANFIDNNGDPMDTSGHGSHCAGTIAAVGNNAKGVVGVNWQAKIMAIKVIGGGSTADVIAEAIRWATDQGAYVLSNSWGPGSRNPSDPVIEDAVRYAYKKSCVIVFAAGNNHDDVQYYSPANMDEVVAVAATDHNDIKADFSNWGEKIAVSAPGVDVFSTIPGNGYTRMSGTSMACPHVAGLAALIISRIISRRCFYSNAEIMNIIKSTTDNIDSLNPSYAGLLGTGRINANNAVSKATQKIQGTSFVFSHIMNLQNIVRKNLFFLFLVDILKIRNGDMLSSEHEGTTILPICFQWVLQKLRVIR